MFEYIKSSVSSDFFKNQRLFFEVYNRIFV